jgi:hypothetical protein
VRRFALAAVLLVLAGCGGGHSDSPESVVRAWSAALNRADDGAAASLFAPGAQIIQGDSEFVLVTREQARAWNDDLPCSGTIEKLETKGELVTATFLLDDRPGHTCDAPGAHALAAVRVHAGKIVLWHELGTEAGAPVPVV